MAKTILHWIVTFLMALALVLYVSSCGSSRRGADSRISSPSKDGWTTVTMPVRVELEKPMSLSASGRATMVRDSLVHISIRFIGMEVGVFRATADSIFIVDKYHKSYFAEPLATVLGPRWQKLTLGDLQSMILGQMPVPAQAPAKITLSNLTQTPAGEVAADVAVKATTSRGDVDASFEWNLKSAKWNQPVVWPTFSIPRGASRITMESVERQLKALSF